MVIFNIKKIRENKKLSIRKLSQLTGISRTYLNDLENNRKFNPTLDTLYKISSVLDVNIKKLFYTELDIDILKLEMYKKIDEFGVNSEEVLEISQVIDLLINIEMRDK